MNNNIKVSLSTKHIFIFVAICFLFAGVQVRAAEIFFGVSDENIGLNTKFEVEIFINTQGESVNAIEGQIIFPSDILELKEIRDANSIINFWIDKPENNLSGQVNFSGIIPGGYQGERGLLFSLIFLSKNQGRGTINIQATKALLNDGNGTAALLSISPYQFTISGTGTASSVSTIIDKERPESFIPKVVSDPNLFDGKYFLVFATQDKGSGIDHYEIKEAKYKSFDFFAKWITAESPYALHDQKLKSYIFIKAVDRSGNMQIEGISPQNPLAWYENYLVWFIIIITVLILMLAIKKIWEKRYI